MAEILNIAVLIYPGVEVMDMNGPIDVFEKANRYNKNRYNIFTVAESEGAIESEGLAVRMTPRYTLTNCVPPDIIVIPGQVIQGNPPRFGSGSDNLREWIKDQAQRPRAIILSVCVGMYILAETGLLNGKRATTHWKAIDDIQRQYPDITFIKNVRYIADGNFISAGGITSGIDGALYLVSVIDGSSIAQEVADIMVYNREIPLPPMTILPG